MTRKIRGDRHLDHLPIRMMMDDEESLDTNLNDDRAMMKIRRIMSAFLGHLGPLQDRP